MFRDDCSDVVGFSSCHVEDRVLNESSTQTNARTTEDEGTQTTTSQSSKIQTESSKGVVGEPTYDASKLSQFLNRIYPSLIDELDKVGFPSIEENETNNDVNVMKLHVIPCQSKKVLKVSSLSWSCTGMTLAISCSEIIHDGWCTHDGQINFYNTSKPNFAVLPPSHTLNTVSCVTCVAHHPWEPSVLAAGLYDGEVMVWDMRHEEDIVLTNKKQGSESCKHTDTVTCLVWTKDATGPLLVSAGCDGRILVWKVSFTNQALQLSQKLLITTEYSPSKTRSIDEGLEIKCISFWPEVENEFVAGVDGGGVLTCSLRATRGIPSKPDYSDPVVFKCKPHSGIVTCVDCSPSSDMFASCGTDSEIHIYKLRQLETLHTIHTDFPLLGVLWTDIPNVIASWGLSTDLECYRITAEEKLPYHSLRNDNEITTVRLNKQRKGVTAVGSATGQTSIWMLPTSLIL